jgi:hypothetical protein
VIPLARMDLGLNFENADWRQIVGFVVGVACLFVGVGAVFYRVPATGRGGRFAVFAGVAAGLLGVVLAVRYTADAFGYVPVGWFGHIVSGWLWGVGLFGFGLALTSFQGADRSDETRSPRAGGSSYR